MKRITSPILCLLLSACLGLAAGKAGLVSVGADGKLVYAADERGNRIPDFSRAGYMGGGVALPDVPVVLTLTPEPGDTDDTQRIQAAIDQVAAMTPDKDGARGALLLRKGLYRIAGSLTIAVSGVVLRGEGQGPDGTILLGTGKEQRTLITVGGRMRTSEIDGTRHEVKEPYVPWGATSLVLDSVANLSVGDPVMVFRPGTAQWIHDLKMDEIDPRDGTKQWQGEGFDLKFERTIASIDGNTITLDAPVVNAMEDKYGGGFVYRFTETGRIDAAGVENLRLVSEYRKGQEDKDEAHAWTGVAVNGCRNCWVRNVTTVHFSHAVALGGGSIFVTAQDLACLEPVSLISGGRRYPFSTDGQFCLIQRGYSKDSRHAQATASRTAGPNVFLDCLAEKTHADTGPHQRWAVGTLWDNLKGGPFNAQDRGNWGTGQGWSGAQQVFWNCETDTLCVQKPPTAQNYAIGCTGKIDAGRFKDREKGHYESHGKHVVPRSLYLKQLEDRLGSQAVLNVTTEEQRKGTVLSQLRARLAR